MSSLDRGPGPEGQQSDGDDHALQGMIGIQGLQHSARLAGLSGGLLLILAALVTWMGGAVTRLDGYWLVWAATSAFVAAFGGPLLGTPLLSRHSLARRRLALLAVMSLN
ncbi:MAG: hypothetical protein WBM67_17910, partial [Sedimenticolaceae bacterium]